MLTIKQLLFQLNETDLFKIRLKRSASEIRYRQYILPLIIYFGLNVNVPIKTVVKIVIVFNTSYR